jgi:hypothetical protein
MFGSIFKRERGGGEYITIFASPKLGKFGGEGETKIYI